MRTPINVVAYEEDANLNEVSWSQLFLESVRKDYKLKHNEAVLYRNVARDRWRLVVCFYGLAVLVLPPVDKEARLSLDLEVSRFIRKMTGNEFEEGMEMIERQIADTTTRLKRRRT
jgi:hypothetical protein